MFKLVTIIMVVSILTGLTSAITDNGCPFEKDDSDSGLIEKDTSDGSLFEKDNSDGVPIEKWSAIDV